jgi:hypothetical protein
VAAFILVSKSGTEKLIRVQQRVRPVGAQKTAYSLMDIQFRSWPRWRGWTWKADTVLSSALARTWNYQIKKGVPMNTPS